MKFTLLGTGTSQGVPVIGCKCVVCLSADARDKRLRSALLVQSASTNVLIDAGPDLRQQLLRAEVQDIDAIFITHEHQDHTAGLDDVRAINFLQGHSIPIYCNQAVERRLRQQYAYIFENADYPGVPQISIERLPQKAFSIGDIGIEPLTLRHKKIDVNAFRFGDFTYITDANHIPDAEKIKIENSKHLVINALRQEPHHSHFTLQEALKLADELGAENAYFTHISHQMGRHAEVSAQLPENRYLAQDQMVIRT